MGTRADFYVGRGAKAEWIGSIAWDGYPDGHPSRVIELKDEDAFRDEVNSILEDENGRKPEGGWPWPWDNSNTTDYSYAFEDGVVYATCFGHGWWVATEGDPSEEEGWEETPKLPDSEWPNMKDRANVTPAGSEMSGVIVVSRKL